jgi:hypothetical protein
MFKEKRAGRTWEKKQRKILIFCSTAISNKQKRPCFSSHLFSDPAQLQHQDPSGAGDVDVLGGREPVFFLLATCENSVPLPRKAESELLGKIRCWGAGNVGSGVKPHRLLSQKVMADTGPALLLPVSAERMETRHTAQGCLQALHQALCGLCFD